VLSDGSSAASPPICICYSEMTTQFTFCLMNGEPLDGEPKRDMARLRDCYDALWGGLWDARVIGRKKKIR